MQAPDAPAGRVWPWIPLVAAGLFAVHPIQSEVVNYAYQRSTLLAAFFSLLSMNAYLLSRRARRPWIFGAVSVSAFVLAFASKESALVLPGLWAVYLWVQTDNLRSLRARLFASWRTWVPLAAAMALGLTWFLFNLDRGDDRTIGLPLTRESLRYLLSQAQVFTAYLRMLAWPAGLSVDHEFKVAPLMSPYSGICIALLAAILLGVYRLRRVSPTPCFLAGSFLILLAQTSSFVPSADLLFEHRLHLPMIAGSVLLAWSGALLVLSRTCIGGLRRAVWIAWFGPGPEETYADRNEAPVGRHSGTVDAQWTEYSKPLENGNKVDVRWVALTNKAGVGLLAVGMPHLSAAARHFTHEDVWNARHTYELTRRPETYLNLDFRQMGVGGDDSWGALAHEPYQLPAKAYSYRFRLRPFSTAIDGTPDALAKRLPGLRPAGATGGVTRRAGVGMP